jgi:ABC-type multidrug transport system fused ATPase/permease subunit
LSGGERQRVAAARAILKEADILVMDEPAANLDSVSAREMMEELLREAGLRSVIWITHDMTNLQSMDEIIVLRDGRVTERGNHAQLVALGGWYAQALELQRRVLL